MRIFILIFFYLFFCTSIFAQLPESCDCSVDTLGYANFVQSLNPNEGASFQFHVHESFAVSYGVIGSSTPAAVQSLIDDHPSVSTIVMLACPGSEDDEANLEASRLIHDHGYKMFLPQNGWVASGATDMFLAGSVRLIEVTPDAVGVHSWSDGSNEATDYPVGHPYHQFYIDYYMDLGFSAQEAEDFYYFTINSAPANGIYWMTDAELDQYKLRSCTYAENPVYGITESEGTLAADLANASYQWIDCSTNTALSDATSQVFLPPSDGSYSVVITEDACEGSSACFSVAGITAIENPFGADLQVYPNPSTGQLTLDLKEAQSTVVTFWSLDGGMVQSSRSNAAVQQDFELLAPAGVYLMEISSGGKSAIVRIVKD